MSKSERIFEQTFNLKHDATDELMNEILSGTGFHIATVHYRHSKSGTYSSEYFLRTDDGKGIIVGFEHIERLADSGPFVYTHMLHIHLKANNKIVWAKTAQDVHTMANEARHYLINMESMNADRTTSGPAAETGAIIEMAFAASMRDVVAFQKETEQKTIFRMINAQNNCVYLIVEYIVGSSGMGSCCFATGEVGDPFMTEHRTQPFRSCDELIAMFNQELFDELHRM